ncbi:MAG: hypothetical protein JWL73_726 [Actinomycetia bacterium]|nr:hypothetical protein [Actinomycetes bacterium]
MTTPTTPAGWYADPGGSGRWRWWDGTSWGELAPAVTPEPAAVVPAALAAAPPAVAGTVWADGATGGGPSPAQQAVGRVDRYGAALPVPRRIGGLGGIVRGGFALVSGTALLAGIAALFTRDRPEVAVFLGAMVAVFFVPVAVLTAVWSSRAYRNVAGLMDQPTRRATAWMPASWFVPFLGFTWPFQLLQETLAVTDGPTYRRWWHGQEGRSAGARMFAGAWGGGPPGNGTLARWQAGWVSVIVLPFGPWLAAVGTDAEPIIGGIAFSLFMLGVLLAGATGFRAVARISALHDGIVVRTETGWVAPPEPAAPPAPDASAAPEPAGDASTSSGSGREPLPMPVPEAPRAPHA